MSYKEHHASIVINQNYLFKKNAKKSGKKMKKEKSIIKNPHTKSENTHKLNYNMMAQNKCK